MTDLQPRLSQAMRDATEHVAPPDLVPSALASARRRRVRRTSAAALAIVVLVGGGAGWLTRDRDHGTGVVDTPAPASTTPAPAPTLITSDPATQPVWDPFDVVDAPRRPSVLPQRLAPPDDPPDLLDAPLPDIAVAWPQEGVDLRVLGTTGEWRSVPGTADAIQGTLRDVVTPAISPAGDRVAMSTDAGILVVAASGRSRVLSWPPELTGPVDTRPAILWLPDDAGLVVLGWKRPWLMGLDGTSGPASFGGPYGSGVMVDPDDGTVRERTSAYGMLTSRPVSGDPFEVSLGGYGERWVTRFGRVAYTGNPSASGPADRSGPVVVDPGTGEVLAFAPIEDDASVYSDNGYLSAEGFLDEDTVLLMVGPMDFSSMEVGEESWHLAAWDFVSGDFELISSGDAAMRTIAVAPDLVG